MGRFAPRIDPRLLRLLPGLDRDRRSIAEIHRSLGLAADSLEVPRPSYEQTRAHVHAERQRLEELLDRSVTFQYDRVTGLRAKPKPVGREDLMRRHRR